MVPMPGVQVIFLLAIYLAFANGNISFFEMKKEITMKYFIILLIGSIVTSMLINPVSGEELSDRDSEIAQVDEKWEKWYQEDMLKILSALNLTEGNELLKSTKYRPLLSHDDLSDFPDFPDDSVFIREKTGTFFLPSTLSYSQ